MPLYTYICAEDHEQEEIRPIDKRDFPGECNECGRTLRRLIDRPGMVYAPTSSGTANHR